MNQSLQLTDSEFLQLEEFISRTPRGRAFLREYAKRARTDAAEQVSRLIDRLHDMWLQQNASAHQVHRIAVLRRELQDMSASIAQARREIAALRAKDGRDDRIMAAANELDAIIVSTERASTEILGAAEHILEVLGRLRQGGAVADLADDIENQVMTIFTACSFQDLTGQRTTKVINVLRYIEQRINAMIDIWGIDDVAPADLPQDAPDKRPDAHLLHGPSLDGNSQDEVDSIFDGRIPVEAAKAAEQEREERAAEAAQARARGGSPAAKPAKPAAGPGDDAALDQSAIDALFG